MLRPAVTVYARIHSPLVSVGVLDSSFCLDTNFNLKEGRAYYHQNQRQLWLSGYSQCDFAVWTNVDMFMLRVSKNASWGTNLGKLKNFYKTPNGAAPLRPDGKRSRLLTTS